MKKFGQYNGFKFSFRYYKKKRHFKMCSCEDVTTFSQGVVYVFTDHACKRNGKTSAFAG